MNLNADSKLNYNENFNIVTLMKSNYIYEVVDVDKLISKNIYI